MTNLLAALCLISLAGHAACEGNQDDGGTVKGKIQGQISEQQRYIKLFEHNRALQVEAVKSLVSAGMKAESKYQLAETMITKIFQVLEEAKTNLTEWGFVPGDEWPTNNTVKESVSKVFENVAMFGDLVLRLPDMTHSIYDQNKQWEFLIGWATWFSMEAKVFRGPHQKMLHLMSQEIGLVPKEDDYINPYKEVSFMEDQDEVARAYEEKMKKRKAEKIKQKSKQTKAKIRGPRLSGEL